MSLTSTYTAPTELVDARRFTRATSNITTFPISHDARDTDRSRAVNDDRAPDDATEVILDGGYGWTIVAACSFLMFWINGYGTCWGVLQTAIVKSPQLHTSVRTITFVGSLYLACIVAFGLASVRLMRSLGVRRASLAGTVLFGLGLIAASFTLENLGGLFCIAGVLVGLGVSLLFTITNVLPVQWFNNKVGLANGLVKMGGGAGATVLPLVAQALIERVGLQWTFRIFGFLILITGLPCAWLLKEGTHGAAAARFDWSVLKNIPFLALALAGAVGVFGLYVPPYFLPLFAGSIGLSASTGAGLVAGFGASTAIGRLLGGWLCYRIGAVNALAITALINSLSMMAIWPVSSSLPPLFVFAIVNGCANGSFFVTLPTAVTMLTPGSAASSVTLMASFWTPGYLLGTPLAGILIEKTGAAEASSIGPYRAAIFYAAGVGALATFLVVYSRIRLDTKFIKKL